MAKFIPGFGSIDLKQLKVMDVDRYKRSIDEASIKSHNVSIRLKGVDMIQ